MNATHCPAPTSDDKLLLDIANKCVVAASDLQVTLRKLRGDPNGGVRDAIKKTFRVITKKKEIEQKRRDLLDYEMALNTKILTRLDTKALKSSHDLQQLEERFRSLGIAIENSNAKVAETVASKIDRSDHEARFLESLRFDEIFSRQEQITDAHRETFRWIFEDTQDAADTPHKWANFRQWLESSDLTNQLYWIHGKAGAGKSTLMSYIVQDETTLTALRKWCGMTSMLLTPSFFFWSTGSKLQKSVQGLLRSIIYQILKDVPTVLYTLSDTDTNLLLLRESGAWTDRRLVSIFENMLSAIVSRGIFLCCFLDGLDEYDGDKDLLKGFVHALSSRENVKVCVSSRPEEAYRRAFRAAPQLRVQDLTQNDIHIYILDRLEKPLLETSKNHECTASPCHTAHCPHQLMDNLQERASGVFLWVRLVVRNLLLCLEAGETMQGLQQQLEETPVEIEDLYAHMLEKLPRKFHAQGAHYFSMMLADEDCANATRPANYSRLGLLSLALAEESLWSRISIMEEDIFPLQVLEELCDKLESRVIFCCAGLVEIADPINTKALKRHDRVLNFIHRSASESPRARYSNLFESSILRGFLLRARAHLGHSTLFCTGQLQEPEKQSEASLKRRAEEESTEDCDELDDRRVCEIRSLVTVALCMEKRIIYESEATAKLRVDTEEALSLLHPFFTRFVLNNPKDLRQSSFGSRHDIGDYLQDELAFWAFFAFHRVSTLCERTKTITKAHLSRILDCVVLCAEFVDVQPLNFVENAHTVFRLAGDCQHSLVINANGSSSLHIPILANSWSRVVCYALPRQEIRADSSLRSSSALRDALIKLIDLCVNLQADANSGILHEYHKRTSAKYALFPEVSVLSAVQHWGTQKWRFELERKLVDHGAKPSQQFRYIVNETDSEVYELSKTQSDRMVQIIGEPLGKVNTARVRSDIVDPFVESIIKETKRLGSLNSGLVLGDESTYETSKDSSKSSTLLGEPT